MVLPLNGTSPVEQNLTDPFLIGGKSPCGAILMQVVDPDLLYDSFMTISSFDSVTTIGLLVTDPLNVQDVY